MSSNGEMSDPDSSSPESSINLDPAIAASVRPGPERAVPTLHLWAFNVLAVPAMSAECERMFSSAKKLISPERNRLHEQMIEASECLKNWWDRGLIVQQPHVPEQWSSLASLAPEPAHRARASFIEGLARISLRGLPLT
jgi:hypothetical protein